MAMMALRMTIFLIMVTFGITIIEVSGIVPDAPLSGTQNNTATGIKADIMSIMPWMFEKNIDGTFKEDNSWFDILMLLFLGSIAGFIVSRAYIIMIFFYGWLMVVFYLNLLGLPAEFSAPLSAMAAIIYFSGYTQLKSSMGWQGVV